VPVLQQAFLATSDQKVPYYLEQQPPQPVALQEGRHSQFSGLLAWGLDPLPLEVLLQLARETPSFSSDHLPQPFSLEERIRHTIPAPKSRVNGSAWSWDASTTNSLALPPSGDCQLVKIRSEPRHWSSWSRIVEQERAVVHEMRVWSQSVADCATATIPQ